MQFNGKNLDATKFYELKYFLTEEQQKNIYNKQIQYMRHKNSHQITWNTG